MMRFLRAALTAALAAACASSGELSPRDAFFESLASLCGQAFEGRVTTTDAADARFATQSLIMHVRTCDNNEVRIPFHVGEDRSRTWVITRLGAALRLKHDHRHQDGSADALTQYGGDTLSPGAPERQDFPADAFSRDLFVANGIPASVDNVWSVEIHPGHTFAYELRRPNRHFRVEFDLTRPVAPPPPPWGAP